MESDSDGDETASDTEETTETTESEEQVVPNSRRVVPLFCGRNIGSSSAAQEPVVVKVELGLSDELVESGFNEQMTEPELNEQSMLNQTFTVSAGNKSSTSSLLSTSTHRNSSNSMTAAGPFASEVSTDPCVNKSGTDSGTVAGTCTSEAFTSYGINKPVANSVTVAKPCISKALANCDVSKPVTAVGSSVSEASTNPRVSKFSRWSSIDVKPSLGKSVVIANLEMPITNDKLPLRTVAPTSQCDIAQVCNRLRQMRYRDSYQQPTKPMESECFQRQPAVSELASKVQQGVAVKTVSAVMGRPVVSTARTVSSVAVYQRVESHSADPNCLKVPCGGRPTNVTAHEPVPSAVSASAVVTQSSQISASCSVVTTRRGYCAPVVNNRLKESGGENRLSRGSDIDSNNNPAGNRCASETRLVNVTTDCEKVDQKVSQRQFGRFVTSSPPPVHLCMSDTMLADVVRDSSKVDKNLSQRRFRGFATSTPLRDRGCPPPDMSFGCLSSISLASDQEEYDSADISDVSTEYDDDVVLLDIAFNSDNDSAISSSEACTYTVELKPPESTSKTDDSAVPATSYANSVELKPQYSSRKTDNFTVGESFGANAVKFKPPDLSRKIDTSAVRASSSSSSQKSLRFMPVSTSNRATSRSCGFANSRCPAKPGNVKLRNAVGPVVRHVSTKRTRCEVLSSSSDSDDGMLKTRRSLRTLRSTCARWS